MSLTRGQYFYLLWRTAVPRAWTTTRAIGFAVGIALGPIAFAIPNFERYRAVLVWAVPVLFLVIFGVWRLFNAAYDLTKKPVRRLLQMQRLIKEAEGEFRAAGARTPSTIDEASIHAWRDLTLVRFLEQACVPMIHRELAAYRTDERQKVEDAGEKSNPNLYIADFLNRLARKLSADDLDYGFVLPASYRQYREVDSWTPNRRPIPPDELPE